MGSSELMMISSVDAIAPENEPRFAVMPRGSASHCEGSKLAISSRRYCAPERRSCTLAGLLVASGRLFIHQERASALQTEAANRWPPFLFSL